MKRSKYTVTITYDNCDGCGKCAAVCPKVVFKMVVGLPVHFDAGNCAGCASCEAACPYGCIRVQQQQ
ncbi:MAG: 4Fe-4S binding protein [Nitrospirae bacterium]|nr:4Fe-4S binding protein [Nitrospirota bacterium]MBF0536437.1 4Fe-4S binding protein [Nitrospirota bacterium]MBF0618352.1 4Fe-4S binding protein [Nitrospirota bacterium]